MLIPLREVIVWASRRGLLVLLGAVGSLLLIGCVNLASLTLARAERRRHEWSIRTALGAARGRLLQQALTETLLVTMIGGALGLATAVAGLRVLLRLAPPDIPRLDEASLDGRVLLFALALAGVAALVTGLAAAWRVAKSDPHEALQVGGRTATTARGGLRLRNTLVMAEVGLSTVLLITAGLLVSSFVRVLRADKGFPAHAVLAVDIMVPEQRYPAPERRAQFHKQLLAQATTAPGVRTVALVSTLPLRGEGAWRTDLHGLLRALGPGTTTSRARLRTLNAIVMGQIALALMLLIGAGLFLRTLRRVQEVPLGFRPGGLLTYHIPLPIGPYFDEKKRQAFFEEHLAKVRALPGVASATLCNSPPFSFPGIGQFEVEDAPKGGSAEPSLSVTTCGVMPGYFETMGMQLQSGRFFTPWDNRRDTEKTVLVNETFGRRFWPGKPAIGKRIRRKDSQDWMQVVGVTKDAINFFLDQPVWPGVYLPYVWDSSYGMTGIVRTSRDPLSLMPEIREVVRSADAELPMVDVQTMSERMRKSLWARRILAWLVGVPAAAAGIMACAGLFGVISYSVSQRIQEFGIRLALGAQRKDLLWLVFRAGIIRIGAGIALGLGGAVGLTQVVRSLLFGIAATDPLTFALVTVLLSAVSLTACWLPMHRAAKVDPVVALRCE